MKEKPRRGKEEGRASSCLDFKTPDPELETLEDEKLKNAAGGANLRAVMQIGKPGPNPEKPVIPGIPSDESDSDFARNTTGLIK